MSTEPNTLTNYSCKEIYMINEKDIAPDFELLNDEGNLTRLSDFRGKCVVLYFFSKAMTSG